MKKKISFLFIMIFIITLSMNVKAGEWWEAGIVIQKSENSGELYNMMPTEIKRGDIISLKILAENIDGWNVRDFSGTIKYDKETFEIVETNGQYYTKLNDNLSNSSLHIIKEGELFFYLNWNDIIPVAKNQDLIELKFRVKKNAQDGVYEIVETDSAIGIIVNEEYEYSNNSSLLKYQIGKTKLVSEYTKDNIVNSSYVIGNYLFTREGSDEYDGVLTTEDIMLASKSIESTDKKDMIIYAKNARGKWINAITDKELTPPNEFKIFYTDLKESFSANGVYSSDDEKTRLGLVQVNKEEALVIIENDNKKIHVMASIDNNIVTFKVNGIDYRITLSESGLSIETTDQYITSKNLTKRANFTIRDYYNENYGISSGMGIGAESYAYLSSELNGKYVYNNYEMYIVRLASNIIKMSLKHKGENDFIYDITASFDYGIGNNIFTFGADETMFSLNWSSEGITFTNSEGGNNPYLGTYIKESSILLEDILHTWEKDESLYAVKIETGDDNPTIFYALPNTSLEENEEWKFNGGVYKDGYILTGYKLDNEQYDLSLPVTKPITLVAVFEKLPDAPTLSLVPLSETQDYISYENGEFTYKLRVSADESVDGAEIYSTNSSIPLAVVEPVTDNNSTIVNVPKNGYRSYYAKSYKMINEEKYYSDQSIGVSISSGNMLYTVTFAGEFGNIPAPVPQQVEDGLFAASPIVLERVGYTFKEWQLNGVTYDFNTPVTSDITLTAVWDTNKYTVNFYSNGGSEVESQIVDFGSVATKPTNPTKDHYNFVEWQLNGETYDFSTPIMSDINLVAEWNIDKYTITFESNGGSEVESQIVDYGYSATKPDDPTRDHYDFVGWKLNGSPFSFYTPITSDITLTAEWEINKYNVYFNSDGGDYIQPQTINYGSTATKPTDPVKYNYVFIEWQLNGVAYDFSTPVTSDINLYAIYESKPFPPMLSTVPFNENQEYTSYSNGQFTYTLSVSTQENVDGFDIYENAGSTPILTISVSNIQPINVVVPANENYIYRAYAYKIIGNEKYSSTMSNIIELRPRTYTVTFDSNGGSSVASQVVPMGGKVISPTNPTKEHYTFGEWKLNNASYNFNSPVNSNIALTASWEISKYTVTFDSNGGSSVASQTVNYGDVATKPANPTKTNRVFVEWELNGIAYDFSTPVTENITLVAAYEYLPSPTLSVVPFNENQEYTSYSNGEFTYTLSVGKNGANSIDGINIYDSSNSTTPVATITNFSSLTANIVVPANTIKTYYAKSYITVDNETYISEKSDNVTLYPHTYSVTFDSNGGSSVASQVVPNGSQVTMPTNPTKEGYVFKEWRNGFASTDGFIATISPYNYNNQVTSNIMLFAKWVPENGPTIASCPNCKFLYRVYNGDASDIIYTTWNTLNHTPTVLTSGLSDDYRDVVTSSGKNHFLGVTLNDDNQVTRAFVCGIYDYVPYCIEGTSDGSKNESNKTILEEVFIWNETRNIDGYICTSGDNYSMDCDGIRDNINMQAYSSEEQVSIEESYSYDCVSINDGTAYCVE